MHPLNPTLYGLTTVTPGPRPGSVTRLSRGLRRAR